MRVIVNKAIATQGLIPRIDKHGKTQYIAQVTHHDDCAASERCAFFKILKEVQPYMFPEEKILRHFFDVEGGASRGRELTEGSEFIIETVYDEELQMAIP